MVLMVITSDDHGWLMICGDSENNGYGNWKSNFGSGFGTTAVSSANADANGFGAFEYAVTFKGIMRYVLKM